MFKQRSSFRLERLEDRIMMYAEPAYHGLLADVTGDGLVSAADIVLVAQRWGQATPLGDANGDGTVSLVDLSTVAQAFGSTPHADSPVKLQEHLDVLGLFRPAQADVMAVRSGDWSDPQTWHQGVVPAAGQKVWIPAWYAVQVDQVLTEPLDWVRVDGTLSFASDVDTALTVGTLMGGPTSHLMINNAKPSTSTRIVIADTGPVDTSWDDTFVSRGLIWHGSTEIHGASKTTWTTAEPVSAGMTEIKVVDATGWQIGDRLVLGGSGVEYSNYRWNLVAQDDDVRIVAIKGRRITLDRPLLYDHVEVESQDPVVINLTRNVVVESENAALDRRGHVMFMHNADQEISYAAFNHLGRTDKSQLVTDPDGKGNGLENVRGRYSLHFHRTGAEADAVQVTGVAISGSPGWGLVSHDSNVVAASNVSYDVFGAHFVTELGNERGSFTNNVAVRAQGSGAPVFDRRGNEDFGHRGDGFWFEGGDVTVSGNFAIGMSGAGFTFFRPDRDQPVSFRDNVSLQGPMSLVIWDTGGNGLGSPPAPTSEFTGNLLQGSVMMGYSSRLVFRDNVVVAFSNELSPNGFGHTGVNTHIRYIDNQVTGFNIGIVMPTEGDNLVQGGYYDNLETNLLVMNTQQNRYRRIDIEDVTFGDRATWNVEMSISFFSYDLRPAYPIGKYMQYRPVPDWRKLFEETNTVIGPASEVRLNGELLFFEEQGSDFKFGERLTRFPDEIRYEPDGVTFATGASLNARGLYVGGVPLPNGTQYHLEKVRAVLVQT
jgi:hypothetical protein